MTYKGTPNFQRYPVVLMCAQQKDMIFCMYQEENNPSRQVTTYVINLHENQSRVWIRNMPLEARLQGMSVVYMQKVNFVLHFKTVHMLLLDILVFV